MARQPGTVFPTVRIETHGCKLNVADSQRLARAFIDAGFAVDPPAAGDPDVYVLNSCTVTHVADRKARQALSAARRSHPGALIVASGCLVECSPDAVAALDCVDLVVTNRDRPRLVERVAARIGMRSHPRPSRGTAPGADAGPAGRLGRTRAFVKVQEGCNQVCAYCIVPRVRGRERSVPAGDLVLQVRSAAGQGVNEVVLTGTQLGTYGFDLAGVDLRGLLARLLDETPIARIRVSSLQPAEITDELLALWTGAGRGRLCPHFHVPLQSGSDRVLARMRRRYTAERYLDAVARARQAAPGASVTADVIVGFPGETGADFEATLDVVRRARLASAHVFPYSPRPGTSAARFPDHVSAAVRAQRAAAAREAAAACAHAYLAGLVGQVRPVLWEARTPVLTGLADNHARVEMAAGFMSSIDPASRINRIEDVELVAVDGEHLSGRPVRSQGPV